jgi:hypothetical protein
MVKTILYISVMLEIFHHYLIEIVWLFKVYMVEMLVGHYFGNIFIGKINKSELKTVYRDFYEMGMLITTTFSFIEHD